jgi:hypothetical protein
LVSFTVHSRGLAEALEAAFGPDTPFGKGIRGHEAHEFVPQVVRRARAERALHEAELAREAGGPNQLPRVRQTGRQWVMDDRQPHREPRQMVVFEREEDDDA